MVIRAAGATLAKAGAATQADSPAARSIFARGFVITLSPTFSYRSPHSDGDPKEGIENVPNSTLRQD
jgi:hypothetical protein